MKKQAKNLLLAMGLAGALTTAAAAELQGPLRVTVPFEFNAGQAVLPAGQYSIERHVTPGMLLIRGLTTGSSIYVCVVPAEGNASDPRARMVFNRYGDHYFLTQVWSAGGGTGARLPKSKREREMSASVRPQRVILASWR